MSRVRQSVGYRVLHAYVRWLFTACYARTVEVVGGERVPPRRPVLFVTTHQNNLADGLAVLFASRRRPVFAARADFVRAAPWAVRLLRVLPMYRADHGRRALADRLPATMDRLREHLVAGGSCAIMAEGSSAPSRTLRRLKKGWARLALDAAAEAPDLAVVPVAIEYSDWDHWGPDVRVVFGAPLTAAATPDDVPRWLNEMNGQMHEALSGLLADDAAVAAWHRGVTERRRPTERLWRALGLPALGLVLVAFAPVFGLAGRRVRRHPRADFRSTLEIAIVGLGVPVWAALLGLAALVVAPPLAVAAALLVVPLLLWVAARCWIAWTAA